LKISAPHVFDTTGTKRSDYKGKRGTKASQKPKGLKKIDLVNKGERRGYLSKNLTSSDEKDSRRKGLVELGRPVLGKGGGPSSSLYCNLTNFDKTTAGVGDIEM